MHHRCTAFFDTKTSQSRYPCEKFDCGKDLVDHVLPFCSETTYMERNKEWRWKNNPGVKSLMNYFFDKLLCVQYDNSAYKGLFYVNDESRLNLVESDKRNNTAFKKFEFAATSHSKKQHVIRAMNQVENWNHSVMTNSSGPFCNNRHGIKVTTIQDYTCTVLFDDLEHKCKHQLNISTFTDSISVLQFTYGDEMNSSYFSVDISRMTSSDGIELDPKQTVTSWKRETSECHNALKSIKYHIQHDTSTGEIFKIHAYIIVLESISKLDQTIIPAAFPSSNADEDLTKQIGQNSTIMYRHVPSMIKLSGNEPSPSLFTGIHVDFSTLHSIPPSPKLHSINMTLDTIPSTLRSQSKPSSMTNGKVSNFLSTDSSRSSASLSPNSYLEQHFMLTLVSINEHVKKDDRSPGYIFGEPIKSGKKSGKDGSKVIVSNDGFMINNFGSGSETGCLSSTKTFVSG
jgi:Protein of unknown function (DUF1619).